MNLSIDISQILRTYDSIKHEISLPESEPALNTLADLRQQLTLREMQLKYVIEISEKIIKYINSPNKHSLRTLDLRAADVQDLQTRFSALENMYSTSEDLLQRAKAENKYLKAELQKLEKNQGSNNLFTVEVYQSEIEDLRKEHEEKMKELQSKG
jgi:hypothetical protein